MTQQITSLKGKLENILKKWFVEYGVPANRRFGIKIVSISADSRTFVLKLPYKRKNFNVGRTIHGSAIMCLAETVHGVAVLWTFDPKGHRMVTKTTEIKFIHPGRSDLFVEFKLDEKTISNIKDTLTSIGSIDLVLESRVTDTSGNLVAVLENCYHLSRMKPKR